MPLASVPVGTSQPLRADARRNLGRIITAAEAAFALHGAEASLEEIARQAGVGSATLHRHFSSRRALLDAVFHDRVEQLCAQAQALGDHYGPAEALTAWLGALARYVSSTRGLAASLLPDLRSGEFPQDNTCAAMISAAGEQLLSRAQATGIIRDSVAVADLLTLINVISLATEHHPDAAAEAERLLELVISGIVSPALP